MASEKELTLMMRIKARADEAMKELQKFDNAFTSMQKRFGERSSELGRAAALPFKAISAIGGVVFAPLKLALEAAGWLTAGLTALGGAALYAAGEDEKLVQRLTALYGSSEKAEKAFTRIEAIARRSPWKTEDLTEAIIILDQYGLASEKNLAGAANAARLLGQTVGQTAGEIAMLRARGLKQLGIGVQENGGGYNITWFDSQHKQIKEFLKDADTARKRLFEIMSLRFGTSFAPRGLTEFVSMLKNNVDQIFARVGDKLLPAATHFVGTIADKLTAFIESGKLDAWAKKVGEWFSKAVAGTMATFETLKSIFFNLQGNWGPALAKAAGSAAEIFGVGLVEYLGALEGVMVGLAKTFGAVFKREILTAPGMTIPRIGSAVSAIQSMTSEQAAAIGIPEGMSGPKSAYSALSIRSWVAAQSEQKQAEIATYDTATAFADGLKRTKDAVTTAMRNVAATVKAQGDDWNAWGKTHGLGDIGAEWQKTYDKTLNAINAPAPVDNRVLMVSQFTGQKMQSEDGNPLHRKMLPYTYDSAAVGFESNLRNETQARGGRTIYIHQLDVHSSIPGLVIDTITRAAETAFSSPLHAQ